MKLDNGIEVAEFEYKAQDLKNPRRIVTVK